MITESAKKANRQNIKRREKNSKQREALRKAVKNYKKLIAAKNSEAAEKELPNIYKILDKAAKINLITKNKASRMKSRLSKLISKNQK